MGVISILLIRRVWPRKINCLQRPESEKNEPRVNFRVQLVPYFQITIVTVFKDK